MHVDLPSVNVKYTDTYWLDDNRNGLAATATELNESDQSQSLTRIDHLTVLPASHG